MKSVKKAAIIAFILRGASSDAQVVLPVKDVNKLHQIERETAWVEWDGHTPTWFYWFIELFQNDKYRDEDRRNILHLLPTLVALRYNKDKTDDYKADVDEWAKQEAFKLADLEIDVAYEFAKKELNILRGYMAVDLLRARNAGVYAEMFKEITDEQARIEGRIYVIHNSDIPNTDR